MPRDQASAVADKAFKYPPNLHVRKHGPVGYSDYEAYREWLRDEFVFRCVICLERELWGEVTGRFHIDHVRPRSSNPGYSLDYDNLVYLCVRCNLVKSDTAVADPCSLALGKCLSVGSEGTITALNTEGQRLIDVFRLDSSETTEHRRKFLDVMRVLEKYGRDLHPWLGYPRILPDLRRKRPPSNIRPDGVNNCFAALRERGELPDFY